MNILVGKTFGLGNAVLAVPMIKALSTLGKVDVLVGSYDDDFGAVDVFMNLASLGFVSSVFKDIAPHDYDAAVMSIPFDGRWKNGVHYGAKRVYDERRRPGNVDRLGFDMWKKHEAEYQVDNARVLGFSGDTPDSSFMKLDPDDRPDPDLVYLGIGYKRDFNGFGASKHWGNERYTRFVRAVTGLRPSTKFISTGNMRDMIEVGAPIMRVMKELDAHYTCHTDPLRESFARLAGCSAYFGNDTGMMHAAASLGMPTFGMMAYPDLAVKNPPFCARSKALVFSGDSLSPEDVAEQFIDFVWGKK